MAGGGGAPPGRGGGGGGGGGRPFSPVETGPGAHPASCTMGTGSFLGVGASRLTTHPHLAPRLETECSYASVPPL